MPIWTGLDRRFTRINPLPTAIARSLQPFDCRARFTTNFPTYVMQSVSLRHEQTPELPEQKRVLVSITCSHIDVLIAHELRPGTNAHLLNAAADANAESRTGSFDQSFGAVRAIIPRMTKGLRLWVDGEERQLKLRKMEVKPGAIGSRGAGMIGLGSFVLELPESPLDLREVAISTRSREGIVRVEFQLLDDIQLLESSRQSGARHGDEHVYELEGGRRDWVRVHGCGAGHSL